MSLKLITPASTYPVSLAEAKLHCRVDDSTDDALITALITSATEMAEQETGRAIMPQTWRLTLDAFPDAFELTRVPVQSITSLQYTDPDGATIALNTGSNYRLSDWEDCTTAKVVPVAGYQWPTPKDDTDVVSLTYVAGYTVVPEPIKQWIKLMISTMYENRETEAYSSRAVSTTVQMSFVGRLLDRYRVIA